MSSLTHSEQAELQQFRTTIDRTRARSATVAIVVAGALALASTSIADDDTVDGSPDDDAPDSHHQFQDVPT